MSAPCDQAFLSHYWTEERVRVRALTIVECDRPTCECRDLPTPLLYFARTDERFDEWAFFLGDRVDNAEEADAKVRDLFSEELMLENLCALAALVGAPWRTVMADPGYVRACHLRTARLLGHAGFETLREMGVDAIRLEFELAAELWTAT